MLHPPNSIHGKEKELMLPTSLYSAQAQIMRRLDFPYKIYGCRDSVRKKLIKILLEIFNGCSPPPSSTF